MSDRPDYVPVRELFPRSVMHITAAFLSAHPERVEFCSSKIPENSHNSVACPLAWLCHFSGRSGHMGEHVNPDAEAEFYFEMRTLSCKLHGETATWFHGAYCGQTLFSYIGE